MFNFNTTKTAIALLGALLSSSLYAHNAWVAQQQGKWAVIYGHGAGNDAYKPERVTEIKGYTKGNASELVRKNHEDFVSFDPAKSETVSIVFHNGVWTKLKDGTWQQKPRKEVQGEVDYSSESIKYAVSLFDHDAKPKAVGNPLEIVPEQNPLDMKVGDSVTVKVLLNGKPLADAKITNDYINLGDDGYQKTDKDGKATLVIRNEGLNVFEVGHRTDHPNKAVADKLSLGASYSFILHTHEH